ncbi:MAG: hypothetical protein OEV00_11740 [Acidobacteriota bacterium]|nr:hypothetical protein [Acidobacteriota bacterium]MDH3785983.1 hypothetical protein [Acidobacteriota bacterium]
MALSLDSLFRITPRPVKDVLCSAYGWRIHRRRYGRGFEEHRARALEEETLDAESLRQLSLQRLRETLVRAGRDVPYYRALFQRHRIDPSSLPLPEGLLQIPILEKADIQQSPESFISEAVPGPLESRDTSGTTGSPLRVLADLDSLQRHYAVYDRFRTRAGSEVGCRRATFNGRVLWPAARHHAPYWVRDWTENNLLFSVYHIGPQSTADYVECLRRYQPEELHVYPSALASLVRFAIDAGLELPTVRSILTSAETLSAADRRLFEQTFGCRVSDQYGNAEMTIFAGQCDAGGTHLDIGYGYLELLDAQVDDQGTRTGEAITTGFVNQAMPLIRYRVGDTLSLSTRRCSCGSAQPVLDQIVGRTDDLLILPDGRTVGRLDPVFKGLTGLSEVQIAQKATDHVVVRVVPSPAYDESSERSVKEALADRLGAEVRIEVETVTEIPRTSRGKFRSVVREMDSR